MKILLYIVIVLATVVLQTAFFAAWRPLGVIPNLLLVAVAAFGLTASGTATVALAVGGGLWLDIASGDHFGLRMGFYLVLALAMVTIRQLGFHAESLWMLLLSVLVGAIVFNVIVLANLPVAAVTSHIGHVSATIGLELSEDLILAAMAFAAVQFIQTLRHPRHRIKKESYL